MPRTAELWKKCVKSYTLESNVSRCSLYNLFINAPQIERSQIARWGIKKVNLPQMFNLINNIFRYVIAMLFEKCFGQPFNCCKFRVENFYSTQNIRYYSVFPLLYIFCVCLRSRSQSKRKRLAFLTHNQDHVLWRKIV